MAEPRDSQRLARATLVQALRDLAQPTHRLEAWDWFESGAWLAGVVPVAEVLGVGHTQLLRVARRVAAMPPQWRAPRGEGWLKQFLEESRTEV